MREAIALPGAVASIANLVSGVRNSPAFARRCIPRWARVVSVSAGCLALRALLAAAALAVPRAHAESALYLTWNDCWLGGAASSNSDFTCDTNEGFEQLFCAFSLPFATGADALGVIAVVDLQSSAPALPNWWQLAKAGGCRSGNLSASGDFTQNAECVDPWLGQAVAEVQGFDVGEPRGGANQARIKAVCGVVPALARTLDATSVYYGLKLVIRNALTTGPVQCSGCLEPACLVLNSIEIERSAGAPGGNLLLQTPGAGNANWVQWRGAQGADCMLVPVRNVTWGRVKSLYR